MPEETTFEFIYDDYAQSANSLFHFMKKREFLKDILINKALMPRYCMEDISYLHIQNDDAVFHEVAILQKCFCDIPFHKLTENFQLSGTGEAFQALTEKEKLQLSQNNTHPDYYGKYAIAFSKNWGERKNLQPIHYLNEHSQFAKELSELICYVLNTDDIPDLVADDIINRFTFIKPLRGKMKRVVTRGNAENINVEFIKNFYDEQEWRYVPNAGKLAEAHMERLIANPNMIQIKDGLNEINTAIATQKYKALWLEYEYDDIRYLIVPDAAARIDLIHLIMSIPNDKFNPQTDVATQKFILISKILVLEEIRKDW